MTKRIGPKKPFRHFIREWMKFRSLGQKQVAERMECEPGTVSKLLSGGMRLTDEWLAAFAYALDCEVPDLFRDPNMPTQEDLLRNVPEHDRPRILAAIKALTGTSG